MYQYCITKSGKVFSLETVRANAQKIDFHDEKDPDHYIIGLKLNCTDNSLYDAITGERIPCVASIDDQPNENIGKVWSE